MREIVQTTSDLVIKATLAIDNIYDKLAYDGSPKLSEFCPTGVWLLLLKDGWTAGIINVVPLNSIMWTPHIFIFEKYRGNGSEEWGLMAIKYMRNNYGVKKLLAFTPYEAAKKYAEKLDFENVTIITNSIQKNGKLLDQYVMEKTV